MLGDRLIKAVHSGLIVGRASPPALHRLPTCGLEFLHFEVCFWIPSPFICKGEGRVRVCVWESQDCLAVEFARSFSSMASSTASVLVSTSLSQNRITRNPGRSKKPSVPDPHPRSPRAGR